MQQHQHQPTFRSSGTSPVEGGYDSNGKINNGINAMGIMPNGPPVAGGAPKGSASVLVHENSMVDFMKRNNSSQAALGKFVRRKFLCFSFLFSSDCMVWWIQAIITCLIVVGNMCTTWRFLGWIEFLICCTLLFMGFTSSFLVTATDPGIYPRLKLGEVDPLGEDHTLVYCRVCCLRRPPRTSHCYQCGVCVLEHDHHCGILGGCVGVRSLRFFGVFLISQSTACCMGLFWVLRSLIAGELYSDSSSKDSTSSTALLSSMTSSTTSTHIPRHRRARDSADVDVGLRAFGGIMIIIVDTCVIVMVGSMSIMYLYLTLTSTTRRESRRTQNNCLTLLKPAMVWRNIIHTAFPPCSLVSEEEPTTTDVVIIDIV